MTAYLPPGWPKAVHPPGTDRFEDTAVAWLFDLVPPEYRRYGVLHRYPAALARMARQHLTACVEAARDGYRTARTDLSEVLPPNALDVMMDAYRREGSRLVAAAKGAELIEQALHGAEFTPRL